jgi:hypothetical protein
MFTMAIIQETSIQYDCANSFDVLLSVPQFMCPQFFCLYKYLFHPLLRYSAVAADTLFQMLYIGIIYA